MKTQDCIVFVADSLTSYVSRIESCTTVKVHKRSARAVIAGCGWAGWDPTGTWSAVSRYQPIYSAN